METWRERVIAAKARGTFTRDECSAACSWLTCAVGEQRASLPQVVIYVNGVAPEDDVLAHLGSDFGTGFAWAVSRADFGLAERILDQIEDRVLQLKREATP